VTLETFLQNVLNAMQWGSFLALIAVGYSLVYGVLLLINFAHGDIFMVGAYLGYFIGTLLLNQFNIQLPFDLPAWVIIPVTILLSMALTALLGVTIERIAYRPLRRRGAHRLYLVITALMIGLELEYLNLALLGPRDRQFPTLFERQVFNFGGLSMTNVKLLVILLSFLVMGLLWFIVQKTKWGMAMRAMAFDYAVVPLQGVPLNRVIRRVQESRARRYAVFSGYLRTPQYEVGEATDRLQQRFLSVLLKEDSVAVGKQLREVGLDALNVEVNAVRRHGVRGAQPSKEMRLQAGDVLVLLGLPEALQQAEEKLHKG